MNKRKINLETLPKNENGDYDYENCIGKVIPFTIDNTTGTVKVIDYIFNDKAVNERNKHLLKLKYKDSTALYSMYNIEIANIINLIKPPHSRVSIGDIYGDFKVNNIVRYSDIDSKGSVRNRTRLILNCTTCGHERKVRVDHLNNINSCHECKIRNKKLIKTVPKRSYAETLFTIILDQLKIPYEIEKSFTWSKRRRYDFYLPNLHGKKVLVELHGIQHYKEQNKGQRFHRKLKEQQRIDNWKKDMANNKGYEYVDIDVRDNSFKYMSKSIVDSLLFNTYTIDWEKVYTAFESKNIDNLEQFIKDYKNGYLASELKSKYKMSDTLFKRVLSDLSNVGAIEYDKYEMAYRYYTNEIRKIEKLRGNDSC